MKRVFSIIAISLLIAVGETPDLTPDISSKTVNLGPATIEINRTHNFVSIQVEGVPTGGEISVARGTTELNEKQNGTFEDDLQIDSYSTKYTFSLETPLGAGSPLVLQGNIASQDIDEYVNLTVLTTNVPEVRNDTSSAIAATSLPTRTRFRYQTFIPEHDVIAPPYACAPPPDENGMPLGSFLGDNRSWDPDSDSFKTRSDVVVDWAAGGTITPYFSVGESTQILEYLSPIFFLNTTITTKMTASTDGLKLVRGVISSDYVSFHIYSDVTNPFCSSLVTRGIFYDFAFYVHRDGTFVVKGTLRQVPNHELYTRNNVNPNWHMIFQNSNFGFVCLTAGLPDCKLYRFESGDLVQ